MGKFTTANQRGFTLIEMSIVLVIIGLIVGGILKGQELIESARQKNAINQIDQIKSGVTTFIDKYRSYPGDYGRATTSFGTGLANGNDDGFVGTANGNVSNMLSNATDNVTTSETVQFWNHLLAANTFGGGSVVSSGETISSFSGLGSTPSPLPASAFPQSGLSISYGSHEGASTTTGSSKQGHWLIMHRWSGTTITSTHAVLSPARMSQLDGKYDDGLPDTGQIRSMFLGSNCGANATNAYTATDTSVQCVPAFFLE